mmetsp:Transcript_22261/g.73253  ORF Transcript_22261/g.73253 Transcript_22261/m.73253 type:complete len:200 (+) Transcript_22261:408-1007(+)
MHGVRNVAIESCIRDCRIPHTATSSVGSVTLAVIRAPAVVWALSSRAVDVPIRILAVTLGPFAPQRLIDASGARVLSRVAVSFRRAVVGAPGRKAVQLVSPWERARAATGVMIAYPVTVAPSRAVVQPVDPERLSTASKHRLPIVDREARQQRRDCVHPTGQRLPQLPISVVSEHVHVGKFARPAVQLTLFLALTEVRS